MNREDQAKELSEARAALRAAIGKAASALVGLLDAKDERVRLRACEAVLSRAGIVPATAVDQDLALRQVGGVPPRPPTRTEQLLASLEE
ncbi:MAG: hypothetical protein L0216_17380 [Planctomycetales bacterium]|nr:hypothetical protein [Planctomycetales bacterium]